jgi:hypothetical protein
VSGLELTGPENDLVPTGGPVYGVFFQEITTSIGLAFRLVEELKHYNCPISGQGHSNLEIGKKDLRLALIQNFKLSRKHQVFKEIESM